MQRTACRGIFRCLQLIHESRFSVGSVLARGSLQAGDSGCLARRSLQPRLSISRMPIHSLAFCLHRSEVAEDAPKCEISFVFPSISTDAFAAGILDTTPDAGQRGALTSL